MDGASVHASIGLDLCDIDQLMPMHLCVSPTGTITSVGSTLAKLFAGISIIGRDFFTLFEIRRPGNITDVAALLLHMGQRLHLGFRGSDLMALRGIAVPRSNGEGVLLNLSFGIGVVDAVRHHGLTNADFSPTDLTVE